jgi:hypothetical protein
MTVVDLTPRIRSRATVLQLRPAEAPVINLGERKATKGRRPDPVEAVGALLCLLMQADQFSRSGQMSDKDRSEYTGQVQAYAFALGVVAHPDSPPEAVQVKRALLAKLIEGHASVDALREIAISGPILPTAG